jgi:hypothetical protein
MDILYVEKCLGDVIKQLMFKLSRELELYCIICTIQLRAKFFARKLRNFMRPTQLALCSSLVSAYIFHDP